MSAKGQKQTCALQNLMSALPPIATAKADFRIRSDPRKRTFGARVAYFTFETLTTDYVRCSGIAVCRLKAVADVI